MIAATIFVFLPPITQAHPNHYKKRKAAPTTVLQRLRLSYRPTRTRLVFTLSNRFSYRSVELSHPKRLLIIINQAVQPKPLEPLSNPILSKTPIHRIRVINSPKHHQLKIILDLKKTVDTKLFSLSPTGLYGHRLVIDLSKKTEEIKKPAAKLPTITAKDKPKSGVITVVIDPGHGGKDPGAMGTRRTQEKMVVLAVAKRLQRLINHHKGFRAILTRNGDYFLSLRKRLLIARRYKADIFLAIHADDQAFHLQI